MPRIAQVASISFSQPIDPPCNPPATSKDRLLELVDKIAGLRVMVAGDPIHDHYVFVEDTGRTNPEAPEAKVYRNRLAVHRKWPLIRAGGCLAVHQMSHYLRAVTVAKMDESRAVSKVRYIQELPDGSLKHLMRIDCQEPQGLTEIQKADRASQLDLRIRDTAPDMIIVSDYGLGAVFPEMLRAIADACEWLAKKRPTGNRPLVVIDPRRTATPETLQEYLLAKPAALTPNDQEFSRMEVRNNRDPKRSDTMVFRTMGGDGFDANRMGFTHGHDFSAPPPFPRKNPVDVCGAGDQFATTLALAHAAGGSWVEAADLAQLAAGLQVDRFGAVPVTAEELRAEIRRLPEPVKCESANEEKVFPAYEMTAWRDANGNLMESVRELGPVRLQGYQYGVITVGHLADAVLPVWRAAKLKIGLANGCWDCLHPGHLAVLREAAKQCDRLVVAVNSDESVKRLKGAGRPLQGEDARSQVIAALPWVHAVVIQQQDDSRLLLDTIKPDVLIKGADSCGTLHELSLRKCESLGIRVHLVPEVPGCHTTGMLSRLIDRTKS